MPASLPPSVEILISIIPLPQWPELRLGRGAQAGRLRRAVRERHLDGVANQDPCALGARNRAADQDQAAIRIGRNDLDVLRGHAGRAHVAGHLLALEHLARILALAGRTVRAVRYGVAVGRAAAAEVVALDDALEALTGRGAGHVDLLAGNEMIDSDLGADIEQVVVGHAELGELGLRLDGSAGEMAAHRLRRVLDLGQADTELNGGVAILLFRALRHDLAVLHAQNGDRNMLAGVVVDAGHSQLLCDYT